MENPYQASSHADYATGDGRVGSGCLRALADTRPWVRFCSVLGFISSGFMLLGGVALMLGSVMTIAGSGTSSTFAGMNILMGIVYLVIAGCYLIPSVKLWKYGTAIVRLLGSGAEADLEEALHQQRGFWKFVGIMLILMIGFMILSVFIGVFAAAAGAMR